MRISTAQFETRPELVRIIFPDHADYFFGAGRIYGSQVRAISTRTGTGTDHAELAGYYNGMLYGHFDITGADQSNSERITT